MIVIFMSGEEFFDCGAENLEVNGNSYKDTHNTRGMQSKENTCASTLVPLVSSQTTLCSGIVSLTGLLPFINVSLMVSINLGLSNLTLKAAGISSLFCFLDIG